MDAQDSHQPLDEPVADGRRPAPADPQPVGGPANGARPANPVVQAMVQEIDEVLRRRAARSTSAQSSQPDWTRARLIARWPMLADEERYRQYERRSLIGTLDRRRYDLLTILRRHGRIAIELDLAQLAVRYPELPWSHLKQQASVRDWLLDHANQPNVPILGQVGIDVFSEIAEPWVTVNEFVRTLKKVWPQRLESQDSYWVSRKFLYWKIAAPPTDWFLGWTLKEAVVSEITDPFRIVGITRQWERPIWAIRLQYIQPGRLREALEPLWQVRAARYWAEQDEIAKALTDKSTRTQRRFHIGIEHRTPNRKRLVLEYLRRQLALGRYDTKEICEAIQRLYGIALTPRTIQRYKREAARLLQREREQSAQPSESPDSPT